MAATERFHDRRGELSKEERTGGELGDQAGRGNGGEKDDRVGAVADGNEAGEGRLVEGAARPGKPPARDVRWTTGPERPPAGTRRRLLRFSPRDSLVRRRILAYIYIHDGL